MITSEIRLDEFDRSIDVSNGGTLTISGGIGYFWPWGGNLGIIKTGEGTLKLTGTNSYGGTRRMSRAGTLQIGDGGTSGTLVSGAVTIASDAFLTFNRSDNYGTADSRGLQRSRHYRQGRHRRSGFQWSL